jgi:16S rRNA (guanine527-N7)-methyltransferase
MTEDEARSWIDDRFGVPRGTLVERYAAILVDEAGRQNLVSAATLPHLWVRHLLDSAQLIPFADDQPGRWLDVGSGAGLPGIVVAALTDREVILAEPRRRRAAFLTDCAEHLGLTARVTVHAVAVERLPPLAPSVISARAVAPLDRLLGDLSAQLDLSTLCVLPKGRTAESEVAAARQTWHGRFQLMPSVTDPDARIVLIRRAAPR